MKIKKVIIEGFRAYKYKEEGTFDFMMSSGNIAQFTAIYAPNGFGKTSFYDAVEWALTNNIERFIRDASRINNDNQSRLQIQGNSRQHILRNRFLCDDDPAQVTVLRENVDPIIKIVPKARRGSRDFLFRRNKYPEGMEEFASVFLSQEAIDAFLREEKADARYSKFMQHFSDEDESYRSNLIALQRELATLINQNKDERKQLEKILNIPVDVEIFQHVNTTIYRLNELGKEIEPISDNFDEGIERKIKNRITEYSHILRDEIADIDNQLRDFRQVSVSLPRIKDKKKQLENVLKRLENLTNQKKEFLYYNKLESKLIQTVKEQVKLRSVLNENLKLKSEIPHFLQLLEKINNQKSTLEKQQIKIVGYKSQLEELIARTTIIQKEITSLKEDRVFLEEVSNNSEKIYIEIDELKNKIQQEKEHRNEILAQKAKQEQLIFEQESIVKRINELDISENTIDSLEADLIVNGENLLLDTISAIHDKEANKKQLELADDALMKSDKRTKMLSELLNLGAKIIQDNQVNTCPLCKKKYQTHEELTEKVMATDNSLSRDINNFLVENKQVLQKQYIESEKKVFELIGKIIDGKKEKKLELERLKYQAKAQLAQLLEKLSANFQVITLSENKMQDSIQKVMGKDSKDLNSYIDRRLESVNIELINKKFYLDKYNEEIKSLNNNIFELQRRSKSIDSSIQQICNTKLYSQVIAFMFEQDVDSEELENEVSLLIVNLDKKYNEKKHEIYLIEKNKEEMIKISSWLREKDLKELEILERKYTEQKLDIEMEIKQLLPDISENKLYSDFDQIKSKIDKEVKLLTDQKLLNISTQRLFSLLNEQIREILPYVKSIEARYELEKKEKEFHKFEKLKLKLKVEYDEVILRLNSRVESFFYTKLINSIYQKIDPHPDFKEVRFICEFPEGEKPCLNILVSDEDGNSIIPNLYFSAAQINILSLSIFLARALHAKVNDEYIGCIFIDDPIHSMDSINVLSTIDLLRTISKKFNRQIILSTHDRGFYELLQKKVPIQEYQSKFIELESFGKVSTS